MKKENQMRKLLALFGLIGFIASTGFAATIKDQAPIGGYNYMHGNALIGSSMTVSGINMFALPAPGTSQGQSCQTCLTRMILQLTQASTAYILENGTTDYIILGGGLGANTGAAPNTISLPEERLGPLCFQNGNTATVNILPITGSNPATVNYEGYVDCGGSRN
jgi:hypothetical protein